MKLFILKIDNSIFHVMLRYQPKLDLQIYNISVLTNLT